MTAEETEQLLRKARQPELPPGWKAQILGASTGAERWVVYPRLAWGTLAACWCLIVLLRLTTPDFVPASAPFDSAAFLASNELVERLLATGEIEPPPTETLRIESIFRLPAPKNSPST